MAAALAGALLSGACSKEPAPAEEPAKPTQAAEPAREPSEAEPEQAVGEPEATAPVVEAGPPPEFTLGQSRKEVMRLFGNCAERREFIPAAGPGTLYVEVYQAKDNEACVKRLGARHFTIRGGKLYQITEGLIPKPPEYKEPREGT